MIDFGNIRKFIYFPKKHERFDTPYLIHVVDKWGPSWRGHASLELLLQKEFNFFSIERCQPHSEELWHRCMQWVSKRDLLEAEYNQLMENGGSKDV